MEPVNVVIDTNVIVVAFRSKKGASYKLLNSIADGIYIPNISVPLFLEYESVTKRDKLIEGLTEDDIDNILDYFLSQSNIRDIYFLWRPYLKDSKDDLVLEVAVESASEYIITFNKKDFNDIEKFGVQAITPQHFLKDRGVIT